MFFAVINCIKNNADKTNGGACGNREKKDYWLKNHLYDVQLPSVIATFIATLDHNLLYK